MNTSSPVTRIVVPIDFSSASEAAWTLAQRLARPLGADLVLVHVLEGTPLDVGEHLRREEHAAARRTRAAEHQLGILRDDQLAPARKIEHVFRSPFPAAVVNQFSEAGRAWAARLEEWAERARASGSRVTALLRVGTPSTEIVDTIREEQGDLVVLSTRGRGDVRRLVLGSVADEVVRSAPCPVLTVRQPAAD